MEVKYVTVSFKATFNVEYESYGRVSEVSKATYKGIDCKDMFTFEDLELLKKRLSGLFSFNRKQLKGKVKKTYDTVNVEYNHTHGYEVYDNNGDSYTEGDYPYINKLRISQVITPSGFNLKPFLSKKELKRIETEVYEESARRKDGAFAYLDSVFAK